MQLGEDNVISKVFGALSRGVERGYNMVFSGGNVANAEHILEEARNGKISEGWGYGDHGSFDPNSDEGLEIIAKAQARLESAQARQADGEASWSGLGRWFMDEGADDTPKDDHDGITHG